MWSGRRKKKKGESGQGEILERRRQPSQSEDQTQSCDDVIVTNTNRHTTDNTRKRASTLSSRERTAVPDIWARSNLSIISISSPLINFPKCMEKRHCSSIERHRLRYVRRVNRSEGRKIFTTVDKTGIRLETPSDRVRSKLGVGSNHTETRGKLKKKKKNGWRRREREKVKDATISANFLLFTIRIDLANDVTFDFTPR